MTAQIIGPEEHWLLAGLPPDELDSLVGAGHEARFLPGDVIFREGELSDGLYLILAGMIQISAMGGGGEGVLAVARANEVLGEMGVLDGAPRSGTARAMSMCAMYFLPAEPFLDLLERSTLVCMRLLILLAARLRRADTMIVGAPEPEDTAPL